MNVQEIVKAIKTSPLTNDDFQEIFEAYKYAKELQSHQVIRKLTPGDAVKFTGRRNRIVNGIVKKVKIKNVVVFDLATQTNWNVPASMLTPA